jgi:uncharacterized protein YbjT (DUF2867 family)
MRIVINTPTGHIGRALTENLLGAANELVLLVRDAGKVKAFADRGAKIAQGDLEDASFVREATQGADALFWLTPPNFATKDPLAFQRRLGENAVAAVRANRIPRVVQLSSVGAHQGEKGLGPISGLCSVEKLLADSSAHVTHLRPAFFMENYLQSVPTVHRDGRIYMPLPGNLRLPMIATRDIAEVAAERLRDGKWTGRSVLELVGPEQLSGEEVARRLGEALERKVEYVQVSDPQAKESMTSMGMNPAVADLMLEMYEATRQGKVAPEGQPRQTPTTFARFARDVYRPAFRQASSASA